MKLDHDDEVIETLDLPALLRGADNKASNRIWVGDINDASAKTFCEKVLEVSEKDENAPILVLIDSYGGSIHALMAMIGFMDSVPNPFVTVALGKAMSAGASLLAHGDGRFASPHSRIMIHESSWGANGHIEDGRTTMAEWENNNAALLKILAADMGMTVAQWKKLFTEKTRDLYMSAEQAKKHGLVDHVGIPAIKAVPVMETSYEISLLQNSKKPSILRQQVKVKKAKKAK